MPNADNNSLQKLRYTLQLADNALILGHRLSEWCGHGPILEQDIAITNMALDHLGTARSLYQYAADIFNGLPAEEKQNCFASTTFNQKIAAGEKIDEDDLAYLRDGWDFYNLLLVEQPNEDWAYTIVRSFFYDVFSYYYLTELVKSEDETLSAVAEKSLKEVTYHMRWSSEWVVRLGDGTEESHIRIKNAIEDRWMYTGEMMQMSDAEKQLSAAGVVPDATAIKDKWLQRVEAVFSEATLEMPDANTWMQEGGKDGRHTEHLGYILSELQFMQRAYPNMEW